MVQTINKLIATIGIAITTSFVTFATINAKTKPNPNDDQNLVDNDGNIVNDNKQKQSKDKHEKKKNKEKDKEEKKKKKKKKEKMIDNDNAINNCINRLSQWRQTNGIPGIVVGVSVKGKPFWIYSEGYADIEKGVLCNDNTIMRIASISKSITSTLLAKLLEDGKLDLDVPIDKYLTKEQFPDKYWDGKKVDITLRHLVSHLSGIRHYKKENNVKTDTKPNEQNNDKKTEAKKSENNELGEFTAKEYYLKQYFPSVIESLKIFKDDPLLSKPGTKYNYTTFGFSLISAVIETQLNGQSFDSYLIKFLHNQLGMNNTYLDKHEPIIFNRSSYYIKLNGKLMNAPYVDNSYKWAGGGLLSNITDLLKFGNIMLYSFKGGADGKPGFLKKDTVERMWTPVDNTKVNPSIQWLGYGIGWAVIRDGHSLSAFSAEPPFTDLIVHTGGAIGATSVLLIEPKSEVVIAILANLQDAGNVYNMAVYIAQQFTQQNNLNKENVVKDDGSI